MRLGENLNGGYEITQLKVGDSRGDGGDTVGRYGQESIRGVSLFLQEGSRSLI